MMLSGKVHKLGDSIDTDVMVPGRYLSLLDPADIAKHIFEEVDPGFVGRVRPGDVIVAGRNFGAGSDGSRRPSGSRRWVSAASSRPASPALSTAWPSTWGCPS